MDMELLLDRYPGIPWLREKARRRIPHFAWEFLESGTGLEALIDRNRAALDAVRLVPRFTQGAIRPDLATNLFGRTWSAPFGIAPIGLTGFMWPGGELMLAAAARRQGIPFCASTFACETIEAIGKAAEGHAWFQLYTLADDTMERDLIARARDAGMSVLVVTLDVPVASTRERQRAAGIRDGASGRGRMLQALMRPSWALATLRRGRPRFRIFDKYARSVMEAGTRFLADQRVGEIGAGKLQRLRDAWKGPMIVKGVLDAGDARACVRIGVDGIVVSNHGGRQFDAAPAAIEALPSVAEAVAGKATVLFDSGVRTGLDIARALALGADFVLCGRAFIYGICAAGEAGGEMVAHMLTADLRNNMIQAGAAGVPDLRRRLAC
jgi:L-lactate dehydrogenase (cytochrome)